MKRLIILPAIAIVKAGLAFLLILVPMISEAQPNYAPLRQPLSTGQWEFRQANTPAWKPVKIPVSAHTALLQNGMIEDPFWRDNEEKLQWIEKEDWEFQTTFDVSQEVFAKKHIELIFKGLDTYAQIYLNDSLLLETDNMFRTWRADAKQFLKPKGNKLHIYFESPLKKTDEAWKNLGYELPGGQRTLSRKAQFHYGWDWGPRFVGCGILQKPTLEAWDDLVFENLYITTQSISPEKARMVARFRYRSDLKFPVSIQFKEGKRKAVEDRVLWPGIHNDSVTYDVENPRLWWCAGMGEQPLYDFTIEVKKGVQTIERQDVRVGIRSIELVTQKDEKGETFYFKLNGKPVFAKGANYIPQDIFQDRVDPLHTKRLLDDVVAANMNMLRVWGGGIYEDDTFYQLCDARGIMVWQDFMYACALYPGNGRFLKTAAFEALEQIERLRQHPCISLWCGNNENDEAWNNWGWQMQFTEAQRTQLSREYKLLFNDILRTYVENNADRVPYWESSPKYGRGNSKSLTEGDSHYWGVWHDEEPFEILNKKVPRFMSEYGFQSFPEWRTIQSFTEPADRELESKVMLLHQKHPRGNALIAEYMKRDYNTPKNFEDFVYVSQLLQAEGMRTGFEAHRRNKPYCMGTLYWQLNDVWPVASWSSTDFYGRWKALHYYAREAFMPVAALPILEDNVLKIYGVNDRADNVGVTLKVHAFTFEGGKLLEFSLPGLAISPDSSKLLWEAPLKTVLDGKKPENCVVEIELTDSLGKTVLSRRLFYAVPPKKMKLSKADLKITAVEKTPAGYSISLQTNGNLAKNVYIQTEEEGFFSNNYFDLLPNERVTIFFKTDKVLADPKKAFRVKSLVDTVD
ncbi:MAG: glycoside hydrolase family 2 protein [Phycisphaerae bacterium]|nr:glycoside hydrolase family 2 protein [Saprospiraceae bacterium]